MSSTSDASGSRGLQALKVEKEDINILLLGETGVGKSTFINAIGNYLDYETLNKAEKQKVSYLVPTKFVLTDDNFQQRTISIGEDTNENTSISSSATQTTRSYVFDLQKYQRRLRLIDTPGIGDTRGIQYDAENLENILAYIGQMEYVHAICFLLKPNNSRLTVMFEYCIKQLLSRLEKSASRNIIFVFTNSRSTFYKPGDTTSAITKILDGIRKNPPNVDIAFCKENVFCLDNESFRYLVAINDGVSLGNKNSFAESWAHSAEECHRMIRYVIGESSLKLAPHRVKNTISVNEARRVILQLSRPLAEIADLINDNINVLQRHTKTIDQDNMSVTSLKAKLYVPVVNLRHKELEQPTTVCTNASCSDIYMVGDRKKYHYKQRCHDPCYLNNVPKEMIGDPALNGCSAMDGTGTCKECSCQFSAHMHIYYLTETYEDKIQNEGVKSQITDRNSAIEATRQVIQECETKVKAYEWEKAVIVRSMAKFAHFLQHNAIAPYNDAYKAYIEYLIDRENSLGSDCDQGMVKALQDLLKQYDQQREILENALKMSSTESNIGRVTADSIFMTVKELFDLQYTGPLIKDLHTNQKKNESNEFKDTEIVLKKNLAQLLYESGDEEYRFGYGRNKRRRSCYSYQSNNRFNTGNRWTPNYKQTDQYNHRRSQNRLQFDNFYQQNRGHNRDTQDLFKLGVQSSSHQHRRYNENRSRHYNEDLFEDLNQPQRDFEQQRRNSHHNEKTNKQEFDKGTKSRSDSQKKSVYDSSNEGYLKQWKKWFY